MRAIPIRGMSSAGLETSGISPEPLLLGTPREARSRSPVDKEKCDGGPIAIESAPPAESSHRGSGSIPIKPSITKGGGDSASALVVKGGARNSSARGSSPRAYGPAGGARKSTTPRVSPRTLPLRNRTPPLDLAVFKHDAEVLGLQNMIIEGDRAHTKIVNDCQQTFAVMQGEYQALVSHCKDLMLLVVSKAKRSMVMVVA